MGTRKKALITGITGQDGSYLTEFLLEKGYEVHGIKRRSSNFNTQRIDHLYEDPHKKDLSLILHYGDLTDSSNIIRTIEKIKPHEIYNLGAQSHVAVSFESPEYTANCDALGALRILDAIRLLNLHNKTKVYQASTSELYGNSTDVPQNELTSFKPRSPYAIAKLYAYWITINYREAYGIYACNGILFNHESKRRGETFVTRKITRGLTRINLDLDNCLYLGNLDAERDWGHAKDYVEMQWMMLQQKEPKDYVISTGRTVSVRKFIEISALKLGWNLTKDGPGIIWEGKGIDEVGKRADNKKIVIRVDPKYFRPAEVNKLLGDSSKARRDLGWEPKIKLENIITEMIENDHTEARKELYLKQKGFSFSNSIETVPRIMNE
ncbi:GDP-mannose 4,6-dehydratase [Prochlorococcus marinus]|uniref:GDP-mannose 4,6-dehydratase n=1 Tax=Prochlorococcus marinus TaxID=1219 RepID=UPI001AD9E9C3|nr:GDP-mannose 4,6-dehydratase [Prochlorococcus marinus]MBO8204925.1 GDP-mannose 4,6-dehydratase [Prochlorococcus marinus CUG1415]MBW3044197.1 GDP-mannose 4,6-dehydratase [Prochlorococcus marinus str. MU1415]